MSKRRTFFGPGIRISHYRWLTFLLNRILKTKTMSFPLSNMIEVNRNILGVAWLTAALLGASIGTGNSAERSRRTKAKRIVPAKINIINQPESLLVAEGAPADFRVVGDGNLRYQWLFNGTPLESATNSLLQIASVTTNELGYYQCAVHQGDEWTMSEPASLMSYTNRAEDLIIQHLPPPGGGGPGVGCPAPYRGYVNFRKTSAPYGWRPKVATATGSAQHTNSAATDVKFFANGLDGCGRGGSVTVQPMDRSKYYRFTVYFPSSSFPVVPSGVQYLRLVGFEP